ncbi:HAMP domain-containing sensor histidine kinase [Methylophilus sp. YYY-1]|uniref:sensor histidine kinase n=1 Tax=Methylophilus sp. YYY-1 TaxID=2682087 RepID=UPI0023B347D1|nr:HAMP domain-containing sensor histidine kinase [Methylophilus sp. YYY-1]MDF0378053.1 HAMP domain-containing protein [Methylophilus sp. YYY-1]
MLFKRKQTSSSPHWQHDKPLRLLLLFHDIYFIALIVLAVASGAYGIYLWDKASKQSQRINVVIQEIYLVRGDLYRQMKELFDAFFLQETNALNEYNQYTTSILIHMERLQSIALDQEERDALMEIEHKYRNLVNEAPALFYRYQNNPDRNAQKSIYQDIETGIFKHYEEVSKRAERLLMIKQGEIKHRLDEARSNSIAVLSLPLLLACVLIVYSRRILKESIVRPINDIMQATNAISGGSLTHQVPEAGAEELAMLSREINKMAEDLAASRDALVKSEKQAALGLLVPMLAHNIRNPLASIRATAQVIDDPQLDKDTVESIQGIIHTVDRLERWTGSLLSYLHPIKPMLNQLRLSNIVQGAVTTLHPKLNEKQIRLQENSDTVQQLILTDEHLLEQMLYNLLLNATEASPKGAEIQLQCALHDHLLTLLIIDQGPGMPFKPDPHALTPGPTTKRFGTGLGIPFAFKVCEELGGSMSFESGAGTGTRITILLPQ